MWTEDFTILEQDVFFHNDIGEWSLQYDQYEEDVSGCISQFATEVPVND